MYAMQYTFQLPDNYDMDNIRSRVAERAHLFDKLDGLYQKSFLISEKGKAGALVNSYAPFYIWNYPEAMSRFLAGEQFKAVTEAFGRVPVKHWIPLYSSPGKAQRIKPAFATKEVIQLASNADLDKMRSLEYELHRQWAEHPECQSGFIGLDPNSWEIVRFALWTHPQERLAEGVETFEVLHLSAPGLDPAYAEAGC